MAEEIVYQGYQYRAPGWEIQRKDTAQEGKSLADRAWLVLQPEQIPPMVKSHFMQARNRAAVN